MESFLDHVLRLDTESTISDQSLGLFTQKIRPLIGQHDVNEVINTVPHLLIKSRLSAAYCVARTLKQVLPFSTPAMDLALSIGGLLHGKPAEEERQGVVVLRRAVDAMPEEQQATFYNWVVRLAIHALLNLLPTPSGRVAAGYHLVARAVEILGAAAPHWRRLANVERKEESMAIGNELFHALLLPEQWQQASADWQSRFPIMELVRVLVTPPDPVDSMHQLEKAWLSLGDDLLQQKKWFPATQVLREVLKHNPACVQAHYYLAKVYFSCGYIARANYHRRMGRYYRGKPQEDMPDMTVFHLNPERALRAANSDHAQQTQRVNSDVVFRYYTGTFLSTAPPHLVCVPAERGAMADFFLRTCLPLFTDIDFDPGVEAEHMLATQMLLTLEDVVRSQMTGSSLMQSVCRDLQPAAIPGHPLRIFLPEGIGRLTATRTPRDMAKGLQQVRGCEVMHHCAVGGTPAWALFGALSAYLSFKPNVVVDVNGLRFSADGAGETIPIHPDVFRVVWMIDYTAPLLGGKSIPWRERDLIYAADAGTEFMLRRSGAQTVQRRFFCYDDSVFRTVSQKRRRKLIFVGRGNSSEFMTYSQRGRVGEYRDLVATMTARLEAGEPMTETMLEQLVRGSSFSRAEMLGFIWGYVVKTHSVRWLCELSNEIEVEVYGPDWGAGEIADIVKPFHKGFLPNGPQLAAAYNEAEYVLVPHPFDLHSQRMLEVAACGAIPVVYDCRPLAEKPHGDDSCLWYRTKQEMLDCLTKRPPAPPQQICVGNTYADFARRILADIQESIRRGPSPS
ncbi:MAG: hypothetical protein HQL88_06355 [Magnetococcales bacterium]|nr:hypothetical protein [Magnetococcales bacterium]